MMHVLMWTPHLNVLLFGDTERPAGACPAQLPRAGQGVVSRQAGGSTTTTTTGTTTAVLVQVVVVVLCYCVAVRVTTAVIANIVTRRETVCDIRGYIIARIDGVTSGVAARVGMAVSAAVVGRVIVVSEGRRS